MLGSFRGLTFDDVLLVPGYNGIKSRQNVNDCDLPDGERFRYPFHKFNMDTITGTVMANAISALGGMAILHRFASIDDNVEMFRQIKQPDKVGISIGIGKDGLDRAQALISTGATIVCVDVAHGHSKEVNRTIRSLRETFKENIMIIAATLPHMREPTYLAAAGGRCY